MTNIQNMHGIEVCYLPATNTRPSRVKLFSHALKQTKIIPYDYTKNSIHEMAIEYLTTCTENKNIIAMVETKKGYMLIAQPVGYTLMSIK